jgi:hypothetical protein
MTHPDLTSGALRKRYYQALELSPLEPDDAHHVVLYEPTVDPIRALRNSICFASASTRGLRFLSGHQGVGKSTGLRRLRRALQQEGAKVALVDMRAYVDLRAPLDIVSFLLALCGAVGDAWGEDAWGPLAAWLRRDLGLTEVNPQTLRWDLKDNPPLRERLFERLSGRLDALTEGVFERLSAWSQGPWVLLVDSMDHARGTWETDAEVQRALERLFVQHQDRLSPPGAQVVYTAPRWLWLRHPGLQSLDGLHICARAGEAALEAVTRRRLDPERLFDSRAALEEVLRLSGGSVGTLLRLLRAVVLHARSLPATGEEIAAAAAHLRAEYLPIANDDARWLARVARTHDGAPDRRDEIPWRARLVQTHLVTLDPYASPRLDAHPLIREHVQRQAQQHASPTTW